MYEVHVHSLHARSVHTHCENMSTVVYIERKKEGLFPSSRLAVADQYWNADYYHIFGMDIQHYIYLL